MILTLATNFGHFDHCKAQFQPEIRRAIPLVVASLKDSEDWNRQKALACIAGLGAHEFQQDIRPAIPVAVELLKDDDPGVRSAVFECITSLGAHMALWGPVSS
ncbi:hypothetical protein C8R45DRAFT_1104995 [Mycena sanguinolenta]|nr:hypothetical protein C8R45DRAFT_1104995 [Mycena sanguinolenta]